MRLDKGLYGHEEDSDDDENDPILILRFISLQVETNKDLPYVRAYLLFHRARYEPYINTPFWNTLSLPARNFISDVYVDKKDIQFTPCERSTTDYPVTPISPSLDSHVDELFESSLSADPNSFDTYDHDDLGSPENDDHSFPFFDPGVDETFRSEMKKFVDNNLPPPPDDDYYDSDGNFDVDKYSQYEESLEAYYDECDVVQEAAYAYVSSLLNISSVTENSVSTCSPIIVDNTTLMYLSDSDDELMDSDDESTFLPFDDETLKYHETEWLELFFRSVCFSFIPVYTRFPSFGLDITEISSRPLSVSPVLPPPPFFLDQRVANGRRMYWKLFKPSPGLRKFLVIPPLLTSDFKFYDRIFSFQPSIYDQITRFACLFEIYAGIILLISRILGFLHYFLLCIYKFLFQQFLLANMRYSSLANVLLSYLQSRDLSQFGVLLPVGVAGVVEQSSSEFVSWS
ncbi:unnamed protein product [Rhizophagus irregularis]|nr:unnamed protein product [Rhizophagus irregularis]